MASELENESCCIKHYLGFCEQYIIMNGVHVYGRTENLVIIASNGLVPGVKSQKNPPLWFPHFALVTLVTL